MATFSRQASAILNFVLLDNQFPAKILLFGEYTVLNGSQALAVPLHQWKGEWVQRNTGPSIDPVDYYRWLLNADLINDTVYNKMMEDHTSGWQYDSNIPVGYGVGSSGAYVAAIYFRYMHSPDEEDVHKLMDILSQMESWFHGSSSGMDPLVSFTQKAIYKDHNGSFQCVPDPGWPQGYQVYLLDSGSARHTSSLVQKYKMLMENADFHRDVTQQLVPMVEHAIHFYLLGQDKMLSECLSVISHFQRNYFHEMIPGSVMTMWDKLMALPGVYIKLCGAGGGGYYLVIDTGENDLQPYPLISVN